VWVGDLENQKQQLLQTLPTARPLREKAVGRDAFPGQVWFEGVGEKTNFRPLFHQYLGEHTQKASSI